MRGNVGEEVLGRKIIQEVVSLVHSRATELVSYTVLCSGTYFAKVGYLVS